MSVCLKDLLYCPLVNGESNKFTSVNKKNKRRRKNMFSRNLTFFINILPLFLAIWNLKCALSVRYRVYRSKGPPSIPPILSFSPPRTAAQNFHSDYAPPPYMMSGMSNFNPPSSSYDSPSNNLDYQPPGIQMEYGPPKSEYGPPSTQYGAPQATSKPVVHKHVFE